MGPIHTVKVRTDSVHAGLRSGVCLCDIEQRCAQRLDTLRLQYDGSLHA